MSRELDHICKLIEEENHQDSEENVNVLEDEKKQREEKTKELLNILNEIK